VKAIEFEYEIGNRVHIKSIDTIGTVDSLMVDIEGKMQRIVYWNDCQRYSVWMYDWEIEPCK